MSILFPGSGVRLLLFAPIVNVNIFRCVSNWSCSGSKHKYLGVLGEHFKLLLNTCISCSVNIL